MKTIINEINSNNNFIILAHINPDGDAIGSSIALYLYLKNLGKKVDVLIPNIPEKYKYLVGYEDVNKKTIDYDIAIILDTATIDRIDYLDNLDIRKIVIDHHISNTLYGDINYIESDSPSCASIIYKLVKDNINKNIAEALYTGILSDTGGFRNNNVNSETFLIAYELSKLIDTSDIFRKAIGIVTSTQFKLRNIATNNLEFYCNNKVAYTEITDEELKRCGATKDECSGLVNIAREIDGVEISIFARIIDNEVKISLRSNFIDVNKIASIFGGGGHKCASGITLKDVDKLDIKNKLLKEVEKSIYEWINSSK